jgi:hypothetical protein
MTVLRKQCSIKLAVLSILTKSDSKNYPIQGFSYILGVNLSFIFILKKFSNDFVLINYSSN